MKDRGDDQRQIKTLETHTVSEWPVRAILSYPSVIILGRCPNAYRLPPLNLTTHTQAHIVLCADGTAMGKGRNGYSGTN